MSAPTPTSPRAQRGEIIRRWWKELQKDPAARASLRRASSVNQVQLLPAFHKLRLSLESQGFKTRYDSLAVTAAVLAQVEEDFPLKDYGNFADLLAQATGSGQPRVSGLRFRRLLQAQNPDESLITFGRVVRHCQRTAPVASLSNDLLFWGDTVRKRWAYRYYELAKDED